VEEHLLGAQEAAQALSALHRLVNGVLAHGTLDAWLADEGIALTWHDVTTVTSGWKGKASH
jgi:predicted RNA-binding protein associated with RNAse of E/G family